MSNAMIFNMKGDTADFTKSLSTATSSFNIFSRVILLGGRALGSLTMAGGSAIGKLGSLTSAIGTTINSFNSAKEVVDSVKNKVANFKGSVISSASAIKNFGQSSISGFRNLGTNAVDFAKKFGNVKTVTSIVSGKMRQLGGKILSAGSKVKSTFTTFSGLKGVIGGATTKIGKFVSSAGKMTSSLGGVIKNSTRVASFVGRLGSRVFSASKKFLSFFKRSSDAKKGLDKLNPSARKASRGFLGLKSSVDGAGGILRKLGGIIFGGIIGRIATLQTNMLSLQGIMKAFEGAKKAVVTFASFEEGMLKIRAVTGSTQKEMVGITKIVEDLGKKTQFSVKDIQSAVFNLGTLGVKGPAAFKALMPAITDAAVALDLDLNRAAGIVLSTMKQFGLEMKDAAHIGDVLTAMYTNSSMSAEDWATSSQYAGLTAKMFGKRLEDIIPLLMSLKDQGIEASMAGTQLRMGFAKLVKPSGAAKSALKQLGLTFKDVDPQKNGFIGTLDKLAKTGMTNAQAFQIFGVRSAPIMMALLKSKRGADKGTDALRAYQRILNKAGESSKQAQMRQQGLGFSFKMVAASTDILLKNIGEFLNKAIGLDKIVLRLNNSLGSLGDWVKALSMGDIKIAAGKIFSPEELKKNLNAVFTDVLPKAIELFRISAQFGGVWLLDTVAKYSPDIFKTIGNLFVTTIVGGAKIFAGVILQAFKTVYNWLIKFAARFLDDMGKAVGALTGSEEKGSVSYGIRRSAKWVRKQQISEEKINEIDKRTSKYLDAAGKKSHEMVGALAEYIKKSEIRKDIRQNLKEYARREGVSYENVKKKAAATTAAISGVATETQREAVGEVVGKTKSRHAQIVQDNRNQVHHNYRAKNRQAMVKPAATANPRGDKR